MKENGNEKTRERQEHSSQDGGRGGKNRKNSGKSGSVFFYMKDVGESVFAVAIVGLVLFSVSGVWPPLVAVESGSMQPHMTRGDLVFISEPDRYDSPGEFRDTGVVTYRTGKQVGYEKFGSYGSVIVYNPPGRDGAPIIHRARFWVDEGENWYDRADKDHVSADSCSELMNCPAPNAGFITLGDNNRYYDQAIGLSPPVSQSRIVGKAHVAIPYLGCVRLEVDDSGCIKGLPGIITIGDTMANRPEGEKQYSAQLLPG